MGTRGFFGALTAAVVLVAGMAVPASATERVMSQQVCNSRNDFTEFFRNFDPADKYCYSAGGETGSTLYIELDHVTWFHSGANRGAFRFLDGADGVWKTHPFWQWQETGCTDCTVSWVRIDN